MDIIKSTESVQNALIKEYIIQIHKAVNAVMDLNLSMIHVLKAVKKIKLEFKEFVFVLQDSFSLMENVINVDLTQYILISFPSAFVLMDISNQQVDAEKIAQINKNMNKVNVLINANKNLKFTNMVNVNAFQIMKKSKESA